MRIISVVTTLGLILFGLGTFFTLANVFVGVLRYPIHVARGGTRETYRAVSGIPIFGSLLLWVSIALLPSTALQWSAGVLSIFDTGGIHWIIGTLWCTGQLGVLTRGRHGGR